MKNIFLIFIISSSIIGQTLNKNYSVEQSINGDARKIGEYNFVEYSVKSNDGKLLYQIIDKVDYDIPFSKLEVFEDGSSALVSLIYGTLTFISNGGEKIRSVEVGANLEIEYERNLLSVVDDKSLLVLFNEQNKKSSTIQIYDETGNMKSEYKISIINVNGIAYSKNLNQIYLSYIAWSNSGKLTKKLALLNSSGEVVKNYKTNFEKGFFTEDNKFIGISNKSVFSINTVNLKMDYEIKAEENSIFIDVTENSNSLIVAQAKNPELKEGEWYYKNPTIIRLDSSGTVVMRNNLRTELFKNYKFQKVNTGVEFITDSF